MIAVLACAILPLTVSGDLCDYVNPFIGATTYGGPDAAGLGKTFPGAATPFGMVQLSPDTITGGDNGPGYSYHHKSIEGFSFTHMSGIGWYGDLGNLLVTPTIGELRTNSGREALPHSGYRSTFSHSTEQASPGYYSVDLSDSGIRAEMTAAPHSGMLRFTFPENERSRIQIDLARRVGGTSTLQSIHVVDDTTIEGEMVCTPEGGGWGNGDGHPNYTVYFRGQFSKPLKNFGVWSADMPEGISRKRESIESDQFQRVAADAKRLPGMKSFEGKHLGFYSEFATKKGEQVCFKAGISFSSLAGARANLNQEIRDWNFDGLRAKARDMWRKALGSIQVSGGTEDQKTIFYTGLYHAQIDPRSITDVTGEHPSGDGKTRTDARFVYRSIFSGWDVFRSEFPLLTLIAPKVVNDDINSWLELGDISGRKYLERWEFLNAFSGCMVGNPAISVIADAYQKGIRDFDVARAYEYSRNTSEKFGNGDLGFVPGDLSKTLEYGYTEWCQAQLAGWLDKPADKALYAKRSQSYRNVFDADSEWFRAKDEQGNWLPWPKEGRLGWVWCAEANPYQQGWFVPHDPAGFMGLLGGSDKAISELESFFAKTPKGMMWNEYYNHANEPVHFAPFLFNEFGAPWLTQKWTHEVCAQAYHNSVEGLCGNDDVGQMSAWYVLTAMGFHPTCPGDGKYEICGPLFDKVILKLDKRYASGKTFTITAKRAAPTDIYIQSAKLNGISISRSWISHREVAKGGTLEFTMGAQPNRQWGLAERPFSGK